MKKKILVLLFAFVLSANLRAQVTIGGLVAPKAGALLDLNSSTKGGLTLSNVKLENLHAIPATGFVGITAVQESNLDLTGMLVYHTGENNIPTGIYVWNGDNWTPIGQDCRELSAITIETQERVILQNKNVTLFATTPSSHCLAEQYEWYRTDGTSENYEAAPFATTGPNLTLALSDFPVSPALYKVKVVVNSPYSPASVTSSNEVLIAVGGCPAKISADSYPSGWVIFQCNNLGGEPITSDAQVMAGLTRAHHGDWYKYGARNYSMKNEEATDTYASAGTGSGQWQNTTDYPYQSTGEWSEANNPCPAGWRIPTLDELYKGVNPTYKPVSLLPDPSNNTWLNGEFTNVYKAGDFLYLPIAGIRDYSNGSLDYRGIFGHYWAGTGSNFTLEITSNGYNTDSNNRHYAHSIRCVWAGQ
jgi:hypothetical protein